MGDSPSSLFRALTPAISRVGTATAIILLFGSLARFFIGEGGAYFAFATLAVITFTLPAIYYELFVIPYPEPMSEPDSDSDSS